MGQHPQAELVHVIRHRLGRAAVRSGLVGIEPIPLSIVDKGRVIAEDIGVEFQLDAVGVGDGERLRKRWGSSVSN